MFCTDMGGPEHALGWRTRHPVLIRRVIFVEHHTFRRVHFVAFVRKSNGVEMTAFGGVIVSSLRLTGTARKWSIAEGCIRTEQVEAIFTSSIVLNPSEYGCKLWC